MAASENLGPQFHATSASLQPGEMITPEHGRSGYTFSTPTRSTAERYIIYGGHNGDNDPHADVYHAPRGFVYEVEHTGPAEHDPMYADNPDGEVAYRSKDPMRVKRTMSVLTGDMDWIHRVPPGSPNSARQR